MSVTQKKIAVLTGGVGGAKLVDGLYRVLSAENLSVIVNTGDDFEHWGLWISPDLDTVMYTLAGVANPKHGWGIANDTFQVLSAMKTRGAASWFAIGDYDLTTDLIRSEMLATDQTLTQATKKLCDDYSIRCRVLPMCDAPRPTYVECENSRVLPFQRWLVEEGAASALRKLQYRGDASPSAEVVQALREAELVIIAPSNPYTSIDPILALPSIKEILNSKLVIAMSPLVHGRAVKGPLANMIKTIDRVEPSSAFIAQHYSPFLDGLIVNRGDKTSSPTPQMESDILMKDVDDRIRVAYEVLHFSEAIS